MAQNGTMQNFGSTNHHGTAFAPKQLLQVERKVRAWKVQKCISIVSAENVLTSVGLETTPFHLEGSKGLGMEICETLDLPIPMVPRLHQSNGYIKRKVRAWRV